LPVRFTPHDFRRLFATELVGSGLPLHVASTLLGHLNLETTRGYTQSSRNRSSRPITPFIERRRSKRRNYQMRAATAEE
jgi:integrase